MVSYERKYIDKIKGMGFSGFLGALHLVFGVWLVSTALWVLGKKEIFPWWGMDINIISSWLLLAIGVSSLMIFFNFVKSGNVHRILAIVNLVLLAGFFLYLSQFLVSSEFNDLSMFFDKLYNYYSFGLVTLSLFTLIVAIPSVLTFFSKPAGEKKKVFLTATLLVLIVVFASLGAYYLYLNNQKNSMLAGEFGDIRIYKIEPDASRGSLFGMSSMYPYFIDSPGDTTGHPISKDTYEAMQFLKSKEGGKVLAWWDFELEIKAAGKEPVISYASEAIKPTIARPASLYDKFEPDEKVADVSRFFATDSEEMAKSIAEKYGADLVYISRQRMNDLIGVMVFASPDFNAQNQDIMNPEAYFEKTIKSTMGYRFNSGAEFKYFDKIFENKDVIIYQLKK
ncbi:MAG: hypothetical protein O8C63_01925 [Candidatus Methanoperedens sp.]|nr:hypothetical protein [Candidatus Methanoperedens sp.]